MQEATRPGRRARQRRRTSRPRAATRDATPFWAVQGYELSTDTRPAVTPRPPATATQPRRVPKTRLWHALEYGPIWTQKGPSRISPKQPLTCGDAGGRYWDRTSDLFRVRHRKRVRRGPSACVCAGQSGAKSSPVSREHGRTRSRWGTRWGTRAMGRRGQHGCHRWSSHPLTCRRRRRAPTLPWRSVTACPPGS